MIVDQTGSHFIFGYHSRIYEGYQYITYKGNPLTNKEYLDYWGKWLVFGARQNHDKLAKKLDTYVESGHIACLKYDKKALINLGMEECVMCVFCDKRNRDDVWNILSGQGVKLKAWIYDRETVKMWLPDGVLLENWIKSEKLSDNIAENVRQDSRKRFSEILDYPDKVFTGWQQ